MLSSHRYSFSDFSVGSCIVTNLSSANDIANVLTEYSGRLDGTFILIALYCAFNIPIVPRAPPLNVSGSVVNSSTIMLNWNPPDVDDQNGIVRYYVVNVTELQTGNIFQFTANATSLTVTSLHPAYTYEITVSAATIGPGPFSPTLSLQTDEAGKNLFFSVESCELHFVTFFQLQLPVAFLAISVHQW